MNAILPLTSSSTIDWLLFHFTDWLIDCHTYAEEVADLFDRCQAVGEVFFTLDEEELLPREHLQPIVDEDAVHTDGYWPHGQGVVRLSENKNKNNVMGKRFSNQRLVA